MCPTTDVSLLSQDSQKFCAPPFPSFMPNFYKMRYNHSTNLKVIAHYTVASQQNFTFLYFFPSNTFKPKVMWKHSHISCLLPYNTNHPPTYLGRCYQCPITVTTFLIAAWRYDRMATATIAQTQH